MNKFKLILISIFILVVSCSESPTVSFSNTFHRAFNNYKPIRDTQQLLIMNFESELRIDKENNFEEYFTYFFEKGVKLKKNEPTVINYLQQKVRKYTEYIFDYEEGGVFETFYYDEFYSKTKYYTFYSFDYEDLNNELSLLMLFEELFIKQNLKDMINWQVDLVIPRQSLANPVLEFEIPRDEVIKAENFEPAINFVPSTVQSSLSVVQETEAVVLIFGASNDNKTIEMKLELYNLNILNEEDFLLSPQQKLNYSGYTNSLQLNL
jgi:hypothetical protein